MDVSDQLLKLAQARDAGLLSADEFEAQRRALLARSLATVPPVAAATGAGTPGLTSVGAYTLVEVVGEGGMGAVYRGRHRVGAMAARQGGDVAVKVLHPHLARDPSFIERFKREAEALAALDHPNIVKVFDLVEESGRLALVMEWVPGVSLGEMIGRQTGPMPWERARTLVGPLCAAVDHAHARGIVHRDLKPDNVRITPEGVVKVLDFGIARLSDSRGATQTGTAMGTVDYMAPEQFASASSVDARADVYALGMTLYEIVAGRLPWEPSETEFGVLRRKHDGDIPLPTTYYPSIPPWVVDAIMAAIREDRERRTPDVRSFERALMAPQSGGHGVDPELTDPGPRVSASPAPVAAKAAASPSTARAVPPPVAAGPAREEPHDADLILEDVEPAAAPAAVPPAAPKGGSAKVLGALAVVAVVALAGGGWAFHAAQHASACNTLAGLRDELREQKTVGTLNNADVLNSILERATSNLETCPESDVGRSVLALGEVWKAGWQMAKATLQPEELARVRAAVEPVRDLAQPEAQVAVLALDTSACRLMPEGSADRSGYCADAPGRLTRAMSLARGDDWGWLRVEASWAVAMSGLADSERAFEGAQYARAKSGAIASLPACLDAVGDAKFAPVNGTEMLETCMQLAGYAMDVQSYYDITDQWLTARSAQNLPLDDRALGMVYTFVAPACGNMRQGNDRLPVPKKGKLGAGDWPDWCREVGGTAIGCRDRSRQPEIPVCNCFPYTGGAPIAFQPRAAGVCPTFIDASCVYQLGQPPRNAGVPWDDVDRATPARGVCAL